MKTEIWWWGAHLTLMLKLMEACSNFVLSYFLAFSNVIRGGNDTFRIFCSMILTEKNLNFSSEANLKQATQYIFQFKSRRRVWKRLNVWLFFLDLSICLNMASLLLKSTCGAVEKFYLTNGHLRSFIFFGFDVVVF